MSSSLTSKIQARISKITNHALLKDSLWLKATLGCEIFRQLLWHIDSQIIMSIFPSNRLSWICFFLGILRTSAFCKLLSQSAMKDMISRPANFFKSQSYTCSNLSLPSSPSLRRCKWQRLIRKYTYNAVILERVLQKL